jgi:hypothetical protein
VWIIYVFSAVVSGAAVAHFSSVAVFLPIVALVFVILDACWNQRIEAHSRREN